MSANVLLLSLTDAAGFPVKDAELAAYFVMPGMFCGHIPAAVQPLAAGEYEITGIPVMEGAWQANVTIKQGEETLVALHSFKAK
jgi:nitrogen fixation protein FixH